MLVEEDHGKKIVVPGSDECEDRLRCHRRLHNREHNRVKGPKFSRAVDTRRLHDLHRQGSLEILLHEEYRHRSRDRRKDDHELVIGKVELIARAEKADHGNGSGEHHDAHDQSEKGFLQFPLIGVDGIGGKRGEIHGQHRNTDGDDERILHAQKRLEFFLRL